MPCSNWPAAGKERPTQSTKPWSHDTTAAQRAAHLFIQSSVKLDSVPRAWTGESVVFAAAVNEPFVVKAVSLSTRSLSWINPSCSCHRAPLVPLFSVWTIHKPHSCKDEWFLRYLSHRQKKVTGFLNIQQSKFCYLMIWGGGGGGGQILVLNLIQPCSAQPSKNMLELSVSLAALLLCLSFRVITTIPLVSNYYKYIHKVEKVHF